MTQVYARQQIPDLPRVGLPHDTIQKTVVGGVLVLMTGITLYVWNILAWQQAQNFLWGCLLGFTLFRATFGFTGPWRNFIVHGRGMGMRKTLLMLGVAAILIMTLGALWGYPTRVHPVGWSLLIGAFMFGVGMQWGGCCGSGTAYVAGGGSARVMVTLLFFIVGSVWGSIDAPYWWGWAKFGRFGMVEEWGLAPAILVTLAILGAMALATVAIERARHGALQTWKAEPDTPLNRLIFGPWSPMAGGVLMGVLAGLVVVVTLQPWGVTFGYTLYGAKLLTAMGVDLAQFTAPGSDTAFWGMGWAQKALHEEPIWRNNAANMTIGLMLGAALGAALVGKWRPSLKGVPWRSVVAAAVGGVLMGYGARISTGCNIGAMVNGIAAGSLHGWVWMAAAFAGNAVTVWTRPWLKMEN